MIYSYAFCRLQHEGPYTAARVVVDEKKRLLLLREAYSQLARQKMLPSRRIQRSSLLSPYSGCLHGKARSVGSGGGAQRDLTTRNLRENRQS